MVPRVSQINLNWHSQDVPACLPPQQPLFWNGLTDTLQNVPEIHEDVDSLRLPSKLWLSKRHDKISV